MAWVRSVQLECTVPLSVWNFQNFKQNFFLNGTYHKARCGRHPSAVLKALYCVLVVVQGYTQSTTYPGLSLRGEDLGFPLAALSIASGCFHRKVEEK